MARQLGSHIQDPGLEIECAASSTHGDGYSITKREERHHAEDHACRPTNEASDGSRASEQRRTKDEFCDHCMHANAECRFANAYLLSEARSIRQE
jgi:hypothetical protein